MMTSVNALRIGPVPARALVRHASACQIISGTDMAKAMKARLREEVGNLEAVGISPKLVPLQVGDDPASKNYLQRKLKAAQDVGIAMTVRKLSQDVDNPGILQEIRRLNEDPNVHGIIVQLPLPDHLNEVQICNAVAAVKDVDGFTAVNLGSQVQATLTTDKQKSKGLGGDGFTPCTVMAVKEIVRSVDNIQSLAGKRAVVCGRSLNVGLPIAMALQADSRKGGFDLTTTICHRATPKEDLDYFVGTADVVVSAVGIAGLIKRDMVKPGALVVDVGLTRTPEGKLKGDVEPEVQDVAGYMTKVPGGVGPMTVACLMYNTVLAAKRANLKPSL